MNRIIPILSLVAWIAMFPGCTRDSGIPSANASDDAEDSKFLRFVEPQDGSARLESAIARYKGPNGIVVDLVGAVHIADQGYYEELNALFRTYDSLLYEAVAKKDVRPTGGGDSTVSTFQRAMKDFLELEFQLDGIDYQAENFVHADLEPDEFFRMMDEKGESLLTLMWQVVLEEMKRSGQDPEASQGQGTMMLLALFAKDRARALKVVLGKQFDDLERMAAGLEKGAKGEGSVLVVERNKAALRVLKERLDAGDKRLTIFYGAAHLPDMERRLLNEFGFKRAFKTWQTAWDIPPAKKPGADN
ncbi:MAG: hypothetical protein V2A76_00580 [Planctomycetota bacterium]